MANTQISDEARIHSVLEALLEIHKGIPNRIDAYLRKKKTYHYLELASYLRKGNYIDYNKDTANPWTKWASPVPPNKALATRIVEDLEKEAKTKAKTLVEKRRQDQAAKIIKIRAKIRDADPDYEFEDLTLSDMTGRELTRAEKFLKLELKRITGETTEETPEETGTRTNGTAGQPAVARNKTKPVEIDYSKESMTRVFMGLVRSIHTMTLLDNTIEAAEITNLIQKKMDENPVMKSYYRDFLQGKV